MDPTRGTAAQVAIRQPRPGGTGPLIFARFAHPPNTQGMCGPDLGGTLLRYASTGIVDRDLIGLEQRFQGAWPYLELLAAACGVGDPLDRRVVEAYWIGNPFLRLVDAAWLGRRLDAVFGGRRSVGEAGTLPGPALAHHNFHVACVYPWSGLLAGQHGEVALRNLDGCLVRLGRLRSVDGEHAIVRSRRLAYDGRRLGLGQPADERVRVAQEGSSLAADLQPGEWVALHWDWVTMRLDGHQVRELAEATAHVLGLGLPRG